jgi:hypothetical protein
MATEFNAGSFLGRWIFALVLVLGTYNPSEYSYLSWVFAKTTHFGPTVALVGVVLLIGWIVYTHATFQSMGWLGISLGAVLFGCLVWLMIDLGWLQLDSPDAVTWIIMVILSLILAMGMSWSHIRRKMSGQVDVDRIDH